MATNVQFEERLSEAVRRHPVLYDKSLPGFHIKSEKSNAWSSVASLVNLHDPEKAKSTFTTLRTKYGRKKSAYNQARASGTGTEKVKKVKDDFDKMSFMTWINPHIADRKSKCSNLLDDVESVVSPGSPAAKLAMLTRDIETLENMRVDTYEFDSTHGSEGTEENIDAISSPVDQPLVGQSEKTVSTNKTKPTQSNSYSSRRNKPAKEDPIDIQLMKSVKNSLENKVEEDSTDIYCKYVASEFKKLSVNAKDFLTTEINNAILRAKRYDRENINPNYTYNYNVEQTQNLQQQQPNSPVYNNRNPVTPTRRLNHQPSFRSPLHALGDEMFSVTSQVTGIENNYGLQLPNSNSN